MTVARERCVLCGEEAVEPAVTTLLQNGTSMRQLGKYRNGRKQLEMKNLTAGRQVSLQ